MTRLYEDDAELYDIAFDWDISDEADWLVERLQATTVLEPGAARDGCSRRSRIAAVRLWASTARRGWSSSRADGSGREATWSKQT